MNIKRFLQPMYKPEPTGGSSKKYLNARVQMKKDTSANWEAANPVILAGEFIIVTTASGETRFKVGDGTKTYAQLPFTDEPLRNLIGGKLGKTEAAAKVQNKLSVFGQEYDGSAAVTIDAIGDATTTQSGLMSAADKKTLGDITPFVVTFSQNSETGAISCNKTYTEIKEASNLKKFIYGIADNGDGTFTGPFSCLEQSSTDGTNRAFHFTSWYSEIYAKISYPSVMDIILYNNNTIKFIKHSAVVRSQFENISGIIKRDGVSSAFQQAVPGTDYAEASHNHSMGDVNNLLTTLEGKAASVHTHAMSDVTNLTTTLNGKANSVHTHTIAQVTDLETRLAALEAREIGTKVTLYRYVSA